MSAQSDKCPVCGGRMECRRLFGSGVPPSVVHGHRIKRFQVVCPCGVSGPVREREDDAWTGWETVTFVDFAAMEER